MKQNTSQKYSRISTAYDLFEYPIERFLFHKLRRETLSFATKKILEVGIGTGKNFPFYNPEAELIAIDFSSGMLKIARQKQQNITLKRIDLLEMDVEHLSFEDNSFDSVVSTFVFCTVPDPIAGLKEIHRVLKPSGIAIFLEHMKSKHFVLNLFLSIMNLFTLPLLGTSMLRETQKNIELAGFSFNFVENKVSDVVRIIIARK